MKIILFSVALALCFSHAYSQSPPAGENIPLNQQLSNVVQSSVTSGIIYERVIPVSNLYNFNSVATFNTANYPYFKQALSEMHSASNNTKFISVPALKNLITTTVTENEVDIAILNTQFQILNYNEDSPALGGLTYNNTTNKFVQISGKVPFFTLHNTVIAPTKDFVSGTSVIYKLRNDLLFTNGSKTIKVIVAQFGDGINRTIINNSQLNNQNISVSYSTSGEKILKFVITYNDNSTLTTYGKIYFQYKDSTIITLQGNNLACDPQSDPLREDFSLEADIAFKGYLPNDPLIKSKINYRIFYASGNEQKKIRKPIIIIDGFDPGDKRQIQDCDCANIPECASRHINNGVFDPEGHKSIEDIMIYFKSVNSSSNLLAVLRGQGYDVIVVNHPTYKTTNLISGQQVTIDGGGYYIESNAMALVKLLTLIGNSLTGNGSPNKIAIVGPSMAGQISRYALSYMEKNNLPHNTYLWVSVDSPHLGANIPMGDQALLYLLKEGGVDAASDFYDKELSSPAAQQQLIEFHRAGSNYHYINQNMLNAQSMTHNMPTNRGNPIFQQHYVNQQKNGKAGSNGWPQNLRKVALVNGSLSGSKETQKLEGLPFIAFPDDGAKVLNLRGFQRVHIGLPLGSITFRIHIASLESYSMPSYGSEARIARFKKLLNDKTTEAPNINARGNLDNVPGGYFDAQADISEATTSQDPVPGITLTALHNWSLNNLSIQNIFKSISEILGGSEWQRHEFNPIHSFIPSFSAIAHLQPNQNWSNPLNTNLTCVSKKLTPFDSYYGIANNTQHTSFTKESVDWILKELSGQPQAPHFPVQDNALVGASHICKDVGTTYTFNDMCKIPGPVKYNSASGWSVEGNIVITSTTDYTITVKGTSDVYSQGKIKARFANGAIFSKTVTIGKPKFTNQTIAGPDSKPKNSTSTYSISSVEGATQYQWFLDTSVTNCGCTTDNQGVMVCPAGTILPKFADNNSSSLITSTTTVNINWGNCKGDYILNCRAINNCGVTDISSKWVNVYDPYNNGDPNNPQPCKYGLKIAPNPIRDGNLNVTFDIVNPNGPPCGVEDDDFNFNRFRTFDVKIYDIFGKQVFKDTYHTKSFTITNLNFKKGHYILNMTLDGDTTYRETFIIE